MADSVLENADVSSVADEDFNPSKTVVNGLRVYGPIALAGWIAFEFARRKIARAYYCRERSDETSCSTVENAKGMPAFRWIWPLYTTSDDAVFQHCGLDTLFFLRFMRLCQKVALLAILLSGVLFPIYYYAGSSQSDALYRMTLSSLNSEEPWRFWFTVATMYVITAWTCFLLFREFQEFVKRRHEFMSRKGTQQYSIILNGLPKHLSTQQTLRNYLNLLFPRQVLHVYVALECGDLEKLVTERAKVRNKLEHVLALSAKTGDRVLTREKPFGDKVDAIELHQNHLKSLNEAVEMEVRVILRSQAALASQMLETSTDGEGHYQYTPTLGERSIPTLQTETDDSKNVESAYIKGLRQERKGIKSTGIMRGAGFVTFNSLKAAQAAQQVLQSSDPTQMHIEAAPHVDDVVWENIGVSYNQKSYWLLISVALTCAIILFWTIPTSFVVSLSKVDSIKKKWAWLAGVVNDNPWIGSVLEQLSPLMLSVMSSLAPIIFGILSKREGHATGSQVSTSLLNKLVAYQVFLVFLLPIIGGTLIDSVMGQSKEGENIKDVSQMIKKISTAIPQQSSFFITFVMVQTFLNLTLELLRVTPLIKAAIYSAFAPKLTPRERESPWFGLSPLSNPGDFAATDGISQYYTVLIFILVFCGVAPIMSYFSFLYLFLSEIVYRWGVLCVYDPSSNSDGAYFPSLYRFCIGALIFSQVIIATLLGTKKVALPATFSLILPFLTALFHLFINSRYPRTAMNLPLDECVLIDSRRSRQQEDLEKILEDVYKQPAMAERAPLEPDYQGLSSDPDDAHRVSSPPSEKFSGVFIMGDTSIISPSEPEEPPKRFQMQLIAKKGLTIWFHSLLYIRASLAITHPSKQLSGGIHSIRLRVLLNRRCRAYHTVKKTEAVACAATATAAAVSSTGTSSAKLPSLLPLAVHVADATPPDATIADTASYSEMQSPLAISSIAVSHSEHRSSGYSDSPLHRKQLEFPDYQLTTGGADESNRSGGQHSRHPYPVTGNPLPVLVHIKKERILVGTILLGGAVSTLMLVFSQGVVVASFQISSGNADGNNDSVAAQRVQDYNFYVGAVTALFVKPLMALVVLVVPVALLCYATRAYMQKQRTWKAQVAIFLVVNAILWLLSNGFHAANVHMTASRIDPVLRSADLSAINTVKVDESSTPLTTQENTEVRNTILRDAMQTHQQPQSSMKCDRKSPRRLPALVEFGFSTRDWFQNLLPTAPAPEGSLKVKVSELSETSGMASKVLPIAPSSARNLFTYGLHLMDEFFRDPAVQSAGSGSSADFELTLPSSFDSAEKSDEAMTSAFYGAVSDKLTAVFNTSTSSSSPYAHFANFRIEDAELEFVNYKLSPQVSFDGITFDIPLAESELRRLVTLTKSGTTQEVVYGNEGGIFEINAKEECSWNGCVISPKGEGMANAAVDYGSQVRALSICVDSATGVEDGSATLDASGSECSTSSESSMLVFSFAKRITGDEIKIELTNTTGLVTLKNPTKYYSVTVGRLSWQVSDIAEDFHASCESDSGCEGLTFPLDGGSWQAKKNLIIGKQHLPLPQLQKYSPTSSSWGTMLVSSNVQEIDDGGALKNDFVFPRNFKSVTSWDGIEGQYCEVERGNFLDLIVRNHLYSEHSLQPAYMSALFWLLQSAVVKETRTLSVGEATTTLDFSGNVEWVDAELSIPRFSAILTCSGCALLLLISVAIQLGGKHRESHIEKFFYAHHLARLVLNDPDLPRHLVKCNLLNVANDSLGSSEHLDEFEISGLALSHCKDPGNVLYVPKHQSTTTSSFLSAV